MQLSRFVVTLALLVPDDLIRQSIYFQMHLVSELANRLQKIYRFQKGSKRNQVNQRKQAIIMQNSLARTGLQVVDLLQNLSPYIAINKQKGKKSIFGIKKFVPVDTERSCLQAVVPNEPLLVSMFRIELTWCCLCRPWMIPLRHTHGGVG